MFDNFHSSLTNYNMVIFGKSGAGKGVTIKTITARSSVLMGIESLALDAEGEYGIVAESLGGINVVISPSSKTIINVFDIEPEIKDEEDAIDLDIIGNIEFKNVWFSYVDEEWILKDVSFTINSKDVVAFVGATGAGKTTILSLITRNYDIQKGQILIDGIDIKKIKISSLRMINTIT